MSEVGNVFDNSVVVPPALEQVQTPAEPVNTQTPPTEPVTPPAEGQVVTPPATVKPWNEEFQTPEQMYEAYNKTKQSYENLRPAYTKATTELSQIRRQAVTPQPPVQAPTQVQQPAPQFVDPAQAIINKVVEIVAPIQEKQEVMGMQTTLARLASDNSDFEKIVPVMKEMFNGDPTLWNLKAPIETVFEMAKARHIMQNVGKIAADATNQAYADKVIQVLTGDNRTPVTTQPPQKTPEQEIRDSIIAVSRRGGSVF